jgi:hypothetical protein
MRHLFDVVCHQSGQYTDEEFETAFAQFKATTKPFIFTYFKDTQISIGSAKQGDLMSLWAFQKKLQELGHFYTTYKNIDELKLKCDQQLDKLAGTGFIEFKRDKNELEKDSGISISNSKNVVAGSTISTGGDFIVGDNNGRNN